MITAAGSRSEPIDDGILIKAWYGDDAAAGEGLIGYSCLGQGALLAC